jgi:hypothetical protein
LSLQSARIFTSVVDSLAAHPKSQYLMRVSMNHRDHKRENENNYMHTARNGAADPSPLSETETGN